MPSTQQQAPRDSCEFRAQIETKKTYLGSALLPPFEILRVVRISNLRAFNDAGGSTPTPGTIVLPPAKITFIYKNHVYFRTTVQNPSDSPWNAYGTDGLCMLNSNFELGRAID
jgi:hypothetical protein